MRGLRIGFLAPIRAPFPPEDRTKALTGMVLALLTVLATIVAGLQGDASSRAARGKRVADRLHVEAAGLEAVSQLRSSVDYAVWERWYEQVQRNRAAVEAAQANPEGPRAEVLQALGTSDLEIRDWLTSQSVLLQPPYFDPAVFPSDFAAHLSDVFVRPVTLAQQRQKVEDQVAVKWDARANDYITVLVPIAVALFFIGLGSQLRRPARLLLATLGVALGLLSAVWAGALAATPITRAPDGVASAIAESAAFYSRAASSPEQLSTEEEALFDRAMALSNQAIALDPSYADAYIRRAEAHLNYGEQLRFVNGQRAASDVMVRGAVADYRTALDLGDDSYVTWVNLGWAESLLGDGQAGIESSSRALEIEGREPMLWMYRAMIRAGTGDESGARGDVEAGLRAIADSSRSSIGEDVRLGRYFMLKLAAERPDRADLLVSLERRVAEASVALGIRGTVEMPDRAPTLVSTDLVTLRIAPDGSLDESEPVEVDGVSADPDAVGYRLRIVAADAVPDGATLSARLTIGGIEEPGFSTDVPWPADAAEATVDLLTPYGEAHNAVDPGTYSLRVYIDATTVASLGWEVPASRGPALRASFADLVGYLTSVGWRCATAATDAGLMDTCELQDQPTSFVAQFTHGADGSLVLIQLAGTNVDGSAVLDDVRPFFTEMLERIYGRTQGDDLLAWLEEREGSFSQIRARGTWLQSNAQGPNARWLSILPEVPA